MNKVERIEVVNYKGLDGVAVQLDGQSVYVIGGNGTAKTSFIDAVFSALTGQNIPPEPITKGQKEAKIEVDLGDGLAVIVEFKKKAKSVEQKLTLVVDGEKVTESPRTRLNSIVKTLNFDPFEFMKKGPKEKVDYMLKIAGKNTNDIDAEYRDNLDLIKIEKNDLKKYELIPYDAALAEREEAKASDLVAKLETANKTNENIEKVENGIKEKEEEIVTAEAAILDLQKIIDQRKEDIAKGKDWLLKKEKVDIEPIKTEIANIDKVNAEIRAAKTAKTSKLNREKLLKNIEDTEAANEVLKQKKRDIVGEVIAGVDGMEYDGEQFLLDGLPFDVNQNNTAAQIIAGLKIGVMLLGDVRIARFDGSLLDKVSRAKVIEWAEQNEVQLFIEAVDLEAGEFKLEIVENA